jgi:hypothetical protein
MSDIAKAYESGELCGWAEVRRPGIAKEQFNLLRDKGAFTPFGISGLTRSTSGQKAMLYQICRAVLGKDTPNYPQMIGDCVSFGAKNATEIVTCTEIAGKAIVSESPKAFIASEMLKWRPVFPPYFYGTGRVYVGGGQMGTNDDGSLGSWMAEAVRRFGALFADEPGVPAYSGAVARAWGDPYPGPDLDKWKKTASAYPVKSTAPISNWDDLVAAVVNGYPCPTASNVGYNMEASNDGFHDQTTSWGHQMCFIGVDETYQNGNDPYAIILNNWGDVHGHLKDFETGEDLPIGVLRVRRADAEKHIAAGETYAYSNFVGFPEQKLDKALFKLI